MKTLFKVLAVCLMDDDHHVTESHILIFCAAVEQ